MRAIVLTPEPGYAEPWAWTFDVERDVLEANGIAVEGRPWTDIGAVEGFDLVLPLVAWGYNRDYRRWLDLLDRAEREHWPLVNPPAVLRWNGDKAYLAELGLAGIPTVATVEVASLDGPALEQARERLGCGWVVVKPPISGAAEGTYRLEAGDAIPGEVAGRRMLVQPFEPGIADEGEWSLMLFGSELSHAIIKRPRAGDFRVQPHLGGTEQPCEPPDGALEIALAALAAAPGDASYARVDLIRRGDGALAIMELELIEPALWLQHAPAGGAAFASALRAAVR